MIDRVRRAIRLDPTLFREIADNESFNQEAAIIAVIVAVVSSIGTLFVSANPLVAFLAQVANSLLLGWVLWAVVASFVGTKFFQGRSNSTEMMRVLAYANAPRLLGLLSFIPCVGGLLSFAGWILSLIAGVIAIRESMEFDTNKAIITSVLGFLLYFIASFAIGLLFGALTIPLSGLGQ